MERVAGYASPTLRRASLSHSSWKITPEGAEVNIEVIPGVGGRPISLTLHREDLQSIVLLSSTQLSLDDTEGNRETFSRWLSPFIP